MRGRTRVSWPRGLQPLRCVVAALGVAHACEWLATSLLLRDELRLILSLLSQRAVSHVHSSHAHACELCSYARLGCSVQRECYISCGSAHGAHSQSLGRQPPYRSFRLARAQADASVPACALTPDAGFSASEEPSAMEVFRKRSRTSALTPSHSLRAHLHSFSLASNQSHDYPKKPPHISRFSLL